MKSVILCLLVMFMPQRVFAAAQTPDPTVAEIEAVMGPETAVKRTGPGAYEIDHDEVTSRQLLDTILPQKENALKSMQANIQERRSIEAEAASGVSVDTKRKQCQVLAVNSIERTRCYQELEDLRDRQTQSAQELDDKQKDDDLQSDRLQQEIDAIEQFRKQYAGK